MLHGCLYDHGNNKCIKAKAGTDWFAVHWLKLVLASHVRFKNG